MKLLISRGNFERICAGMSPIERARLAEQVQLYPDDLAEPGFVADQERIGAAWEKAVRDLVLPAPPPLPRLEPVLSPWPEIIDEVHSWRAGDWSFRDVDHTADDGTTLSAGTIGTDIDMPPPWEELGPGCWVAPAGTPPPWVNPADRTAREFLNDWVPEQPATNPLEDLRAAQIMLKGKTQRPRRLEAGQLALAALTTLAGPKGEGWAPPGALAKLTEVPIVRGPDLPANAWRLVDVCSGDVLLEGTIGPSIDELKTIIDQFLDQVAEEYGIPRDLLG